MKKARKRRQTRAEFDTFLADGIRFNEQMSKHRRYEEILRDVLGPTKTLAEKMAAIAEADKLRPELKLAEKALAIFGDRLLQTRGPVH